MYHIHGNERHLLHTEERLNPIPGTFGILIHENIFNVLTTLKCKNGYMIELIPRKLDIMVYGNILTRLN